MICKQSLDDFECIIQDGESFKVKYSHVTINVSSEPDSGLYDAMNKGVACAIGDCICFMNSGDFPFRDDTLERGAAVMNSFPDMDLYYGECVVVYPNGDQYIQMPTTIENNACEEMREFLKINQPRLNHQSIFSKRDCLTRFPFDTIYVLRAELKWYYNGLLKGIGINKMDFPVCIYSQGEISERVLSVSIHARETKRILENYGLMTEDNKKELPEEKDYRECFKGMYSQWLALRQSGRDMGKYFKKKGINKIAIYGYAEFETYVINELKNTDIAITYIIDKQDKYPYSEILVIKPEEFDEEVDLIVVTALAHYKEVYDDMSIRTECRIRSLKKT